MTEPEEHVTPEDFINENTDTDLLTRVLGELAYEPVGMLGGRAFPHVFSDECCSQREQAMIHDQFLAARFGEGGARCPIVRQSTYGPGFLCLRHGVSMEQEQLNCPAWGEL